jgi:signal transduction histidine kinase
MQIPRVCLNRGNPMSANGVNSQTLSYYQQRVITIEAELAQLRQEQEPLRKREQLLSTIAQVANLLLRSQDYQSVLPEVVRLLGEAVGSDRCGVGQNLTHPILDKPAIRIAPDWEWCKNAVLPSEEFSPHLDRLFLREIDAPYIDAKLAQGEVVNCLVADLPEPDRSLLAAQGNMAELFVPILVDNENWGYIAFDNCAKPHLYDEAEILILQIAADSITAAIARQAKDDELQKSQQALLQAEQERVADLVKTNQALKNPLDRLAADPDLNSFLGYVLLEITQQLSLDIAVLWLYDPVTQTLPLELEIEQGMVKLKHQIDAPEDYLRPSTASTPIWNTLLQTKKPFVIDRENATEYWLPETFEPQVDRQKIQFGANLLLTLGNEPIGLLGLGSTQRTTITPEKLELAQALAQQATLAIQLTYLAEEAKQSAIFEERNRLAGEIHDTLAQTFTGITVQLELANYLIQSHSTEVNAILDRIGNLAQTGLKEARRSVWSVYPDSEDYADLAQKLSECVEHLTQGTPLYTQVRIQGEPYPLSCFIGKNLLRIGQEAITNTLKHAQATEIRIELTYSPDYISLCVQDNGCGFHPKAQTEGFGLISISERTDRIGGDLRITTQPDRGTEIFVQVTP